MPEFYVIKAQKRNKIVEFYLIICPKNNFSRFFLGGDATDHCIHLMAPRI